jgi:hypothetical protein
MNLLLGIDPSGAIVYPLFVVEYLQVANLAKPSSYK